jgi:hypothetical protein
MFPCFAFGEEKQKGEHENSQAKSYTPLFFLVFEQLHPLFPRIVSYQLSMECVRMPLGPSSLEEKGG